MTRLAAALMALLLGAAPARAALFGSDRLDPAFCAAPQLRQTVVYVDDTVMVDGRTDWAFKLLAKLRATLAPGERVTVIRLSPATGQSSEQWSGCWPAFTAAERDRRSHETYFFQKSPLAQLEDQQRFFARDLGEALTRIYAAAKRPAAAVSVDPANPPPKEILRALASDEGRFAHSAVTIRAVVYSDLAENSDLGTALKPLPGPLGIGKRLGSYLRRSVFYAYGVGGDVRGAGAAQETTRNFWNAALRSMGATVGGLGADLNVANGIPVTAASYDLQLELDDQKLDGRMQLLTDADGALVDSWLGISRLTSAALSGTFRCTEARPEARGEAACRLNATTSGGVATTGSSEALTLTGPARDALQGRIGVKNSPVSFPLRASQGEG